MMTMQARRSSFAAGIGAGLLLLVSATLFAADEAANTPDPRLAAQIAKLSAELRSRPEDQQLLAQRAALYVAADQYPAAIADYDQLLKLAPLRGELWDQRGSVQFMAGKIAESIADFNEYLKAHPEMEPWHWKRGISYYYAGRYDDGTRQFERYQTVDDHDVENAAWRYLCMARAQGPQAAREKILKVTRDARVPMAEVYALYAGRAQPADVLAAATAGSPSPAALNAQLFYAHLYLGLYHEVNGDAALAAKHLQIAAEKHRIGHYMWNVADVHWRRLQAARDTAPPAADSAAPKQ